MKMLIYKLLLLIVVVGELLPKFYSYEFLIGMDVKCIKIIGLFYVAYNMFLCFAVFDPSMQIS